MFIITRDDALIRLVMIKCKGQYVSLDVQCLSYLLDVATGVSEPTDPLAEEKIALLRSWFYKPGTFFLTQSVITETARIRLIDRHDLYEYFRTQFLDHPVRDIVAVQTRTEEFGKHHRNALECRTLAEAEDLGLNILLTFDQDFVDRLGGVSDTTRIMKPSSYWAALGIPRGSKPVTLPANSNPLSAQTWWHY